MRKKSVAVMATVAALGIGGAAAPASGLAAKKKAAKAAPPALIDLSAVCNALGLKPLLGGLSLDLSPIVRIKVLKVCE